MEYRYPQLSFLRSSISLSKLIRRHLPHKHPKKMNIQISQSILLKMVTNRNQQQIIIHHRLTQQMIIINLMSNRRRQQSKNRPSNQKSSQRLITLREKTLTKKLTITQKINNRQRQNKNNISSLPKIKNPLTLIVILNKTMSQRSKSQRRKRSLKIRLLKSMLTLKHCLNLIPLKRQQLVI